MSDEALTRVVVDIEKRTFYLYSDQGGERTVVCETAEQFINVLKVCRDNLTTDTLVYAPAP